jgi:hypothetical protein
VPNTVFPKAVLKVVGPRPLVRDGVSAACPRSQSKPSHEKIPTAAYRLGFSLVCVSRGGASRKLTSFDPFPKAAWDAVNGAD